MGRAAKLQSLFETAMTDFTEQLHNNQYLIIMEVNIILSESQSAKPFDVSQMIHQIEFVKVKHLVEKQLTEASLTKTEVHHTIPIFGERGSGKTSFLESILEYYSKHADGKPPI